MNCRSIATLPRLLAPLLVVATAGCSGIAEPPAPPRLEDPPEQWSAAPEAAGDPQPVSWWSRFQDPELERVIERALEDNRDLRAAAARIDEALALARIAGAGAKPQAAATLDGNRQRRNFIGFPIPSSQGGVLSTTNTTLSAGLSVSWEVDLWGRLRAQREAADLGVEASRAELAAARLSLAGQTAKAWFGLLEAARQVELAERTLASRSQTRQQIRRRFESGLRGGVELRLAIANEAAATSALAGRRRQLDGARRRLELLVSEYPAGRSRGELDRTTLPPPPAPPPMGLPAELISRRPDLAALERRLEAAGLGVVQAKAALYPQLSLTGSAGTVSEELEDLLDTDFSVWSLAARLLQPVFQGGRLRAGVELSEARYRQLAESYVQAVLRAFSEVEAALVAERALAQQVTALAEAARQAAGAQRLAEERYAAGLTPYLTVLEAQRESAAASGRLLELERQRLEARIDLHLALGGDWSDRSST